MYKGTRGCVLHLKLDPVSLSLSLLSFSDVYATCVACLPSPIILRYSVK